MELLDPVRDSVKQIENDPFSWLIGRTKVLRLVEGHYENFLWRNQDGLYYILEDVPTILPPTESIPANSHVRQIHDAGNPSAVFQFGNSLILKVKLIQEGPKEHETLAFLMKQQPSFDIPTVLFYALDLDRTYLFEPFISGQTLNEAWWDMDTDKKQQIAVLVAQVCYELATFECDHMSKTDLNWINPAGKKLDDTPKGLREHCEGLGMDCSTYILSHNDLGPSNIIIDMDTNRLTVIDWDMAGYCPRAWVRTKFAVCGVMNTERFVDGKLENDSGYRKLVEQELGHRGFPEVVDIFMAVAEGD